MSEDIREGLNALVNAGVKRVQLRADLWDAAAWSLTWQALRDSRHAGFSEPAFNWKTLRVERRVA